MARNENQKPQIEQKPGRERRKKEPRKKHRKKSREKMLENFSAFEASRKKNKKERFKESASVSQKNEAIPESSADNNAEEASNVHSESMNNNPFATLSEVQGRSSQTEKEVIEPEIVENYTPPEKSRLNKKAQIIEAEIISDKSEDDEPQAEEKETIPDAVDMRERLNTHQESITAALEEFIDILENTTTPSTEKATQSITAARDLFAHAKEIGDDISTLTDSDDLEPEKEQIISSLINEQERAIAGALAAQAVFERLRKNGAEEYRRHVHGEEVEASESTPETRTTFSVELKNTTQEIKEEDPESASDYSKIISDSQDRAKDILLSHETTYVEKSKHLYEEARKLTRHIHGIEKAQRVIRTSDIPDDEKKQLRDTYEDVKSSMYDQIAYLSIKSEKILDGGLFEELTEADIVEDVIEVTDDQIISSEDIIDNALADALEDEFGLSEKELAERMNDEENGELAQEVRDFFGHVAEFEDLLDNLEKDVAHLKEFKEFATSNSPTVDLPEKYQDVLERINGLAIYHEKFAKIQEFADVFSEIGADDFPEDQHGSIEIYKDVLADLSAETERILEISTKLVDDIKEIPDEELDEYLDIIGDIQERFADDSFNAMPKNRRGSKGPAVGEPHKKKSIFSAGFDLYLRLIGYGTQNPFKN